MEYIKMLSVLTTALDEVPGMLLAYLWESKHPVYMSDTKSENYRRILKNPTIHCLKQLWGNTACGWAGMAGQAFTTSDVIIISYPEYKIAVVYINRFAYICEMDDAYDLAVQNSRFPGHADAEKSKLKILKKAGK